MLHHVIMRAFGWTDSHLHQFMVGDTRYGDPTHELDEYGEPFEDETKQRLTGLVRDPLTVFHHEYDFGDGWRHRIEVKFQVDGDYWACPGLVDTPGMSAGLMFSSFRAQSPSGCDS